MRNIGVFSILLLSVSSIAVAQNYVPARDYNGPGVVVNMDVLQQGQNGTYQAAPSYPTQAPVMQQRLQPPIQLQRPTARAPMAPPVAPPIAMRPPVQAPQQFAQQPSFQPPMPRDIAQPIAPQQMPEPLGRRAEPLFAAQPSPIMAAPPAPIEQPSAPITQPQPFSTRELAASAPPEEIAPPPEQVSAPPIAPAPIAEMKKEEPKIETVKKIEKPKKEKIESDYAEAANTGEVTPKAGTETNQGRQLLAQAREKSETSDHQERQVVLFDDLPAPTPAKTDTADKLKPQSLAAPTEELDAPKLATTDTEKAEPQPPLMPAPIVEGEDNVASAPMPLAPIAQNDPNALKPTALPDVAPASIPDTGALRKAETKVDDFEAYRLLFDAKSAELKPTEREVLDNMIAKLQQDESVKLQLRSYANGTPDTAAQARRVSLARAFAVRSYLIEKGVTASRMDIRALGLGSAAMNDTVKGGTVPADRVDMIFIR